MNIKKMIRDFFINPDLVEELRAEQKIAQEDQKKVHAQLAQIHHIMEENARALATLAIVQARMISEIGEIIDTSQSEKRKKPAPKKNPGPEFTN